MCRKNTLLSPNKEQLSARSAMPPVARGRPLRDRNPIRRSALCAEDQDEMQCSERPTLWVRTFSARLVRRMKAGEGDVRQLDDHYNLKNVEQVCLSIRQNKSWTDRPVQKVVIFATVNLSFLLDIRENKNPTHRTHQRFLTKFLQKHPEGTFSDPALPSRSRSAMESARPEADSRSLNGPHVAKI
jgi:hypothetical protein